MTSKNQFRDHYAFQGLDWSSLFPASPLLSLGGPNFHHVVSKLKMNVRDNSDKPLKRGWNLTCKIKHRYKGYGIVLYMYMA